MTIWYRSPTMWWSAKNRLLCLRSGVSGSTRLGKSVILGGQAGLVGHLEIGDFAMVGAQTGVHEDVPARTVVSGSPCMPHRNWLRSMACVPRLPEMRSSLNAVLKRVEGAGKAFQYGAGKREIKFVVQVKEVTD